MILTINLIFLSNFNRPILMNNDNETLENIYPRGYYLLLLNVSYHINYQSSGFKLHVILLLTLLSHKNMAGIIAFEEGWGERRLVFYGFNNKLRKIVGGSGVRRMIGSSHADVTVEQC